MEAYELNKALPQSAESEGDLAQVWHLLEAGKSYLRPDAFGDGVAR